MSQELASLKQLLSSIYKPVELHQSLWITDWGKKVVSAVSPATSTALDHWFHEIADCIIRRGDQSALLKLVLEQVPGRRDAIQLHIRNHPPCSTNERPTDAPAGSGLTGDESATRSALPPTPAQPPDIPRRWLPPNADSSHANSPSDFSQLFSTLYGLPHSPTTPHPDTLLTADLIQHRAVVLLGESGAGKSYELAELKRMEAPHGAPLSLDMGSIPAPHTLREQFLLFCRAEPRSARRFLYLDALDEDKTEGQRLGDELAATLESLTPAERTNLWIRVTSRTASWPAALGHRLTTLLGPEAPLKVLMLQPLSEDEAARVAATEYKEASPEEAAERGRAEVARARRLDMQALTMSPLTLKLLCAADLQKDTVVTRAQLFERGIQRLLKEPKPGLAPDRRELKRKEALDHAAWFAALSTLAGRSPIPLDDWPTGLDMDSLAERLNKDTSTLRRVLTTPLFDDAPGTVYAARRFVHQSFAEWLAARWIITHGSVERWAERLMPKGSAVPAQVLGVASWLAFQSKEWMQHIIAKAPAVVVTASLPSESVEIRRQVFQSLILAARSGALNDHILRLIAQSAALTLIGAEGDVVEALKGLKPEELHTVGTLVCVVAMSTLISLDAGQRASDAAVLIVSALVDLGLDDKGRGYALAERGVSVLKAALSVTSDGAEIPRTMERRWWDTPVARLRELLIKPEELPDLSADDEANRAARLAYALDLLFPRVITATDLVSYLRQPRGHIIGHYYLFLHFELPLVAKDYPALIPPLLDWWAKQSRSDIRWDSQGEHINVWTVAWERREDPTIWSALVETFYKLLPKGSAPRVLPLTQHDRRRLLLALWNHHHGRPNYKEPLCGSLQSREWGLSPEARLLTHEDLDWWIEQFGDGSERMRDEIALTIQRIIPYDDRVAHGQLLQAARQLPADVQQVLRDKIALKIKNAEIYDRGESLPVIETPMDVDHRENLRREKEEQQARQERMLSAINPSVSPHSAWRTLCVDLVGYTFFPTTLPQQAFWETLSIDQRSQALERAREYVEAVDGDDPDDTAVLHGELIWEYQVAVGAILVLAKFDPSVDLKLSTDAWQRWALTVVRQAYLSEILDQLGPARARVDPLPNTALRRVFKELETTTNNKAAEHLTRLAQHGEPHALADELRQALARGLSEEAEAVMLERCASRNDPAGEVAREAARERLRAGREVNDGRWRKAGLALWLSQHITEADKELLLVWLNDKESLRLLKEHNYWALALDPLNQLTPAQLVRLYKQTHHHFPPPPPTPEPTVGEGSGATWMVRDQSPSSLLNDILYTLKKQTSSEAADALEELGREYDDTELKMRASLMRREVARASWKLPSVNELLDLARV